MRDVTVVLKYEIPAIRNNDFLTGNHTTYNIFIFIFYILLMNHCNDFAPCWPSIGQYKFLFLLLCITCDLASFTQKQ
jgi:hypothetical protein